MTELNSNTAEGGDLGRVLYGEHGHITPAVMYTCLGSVFLIVGLLGSLTPVPPPGPPHAMLVLGLIIAMGGAICLVIGLVRLIPNIGASWHLHEHGVRLLQRSQERVLRYEDVDELTLNAVRVFFHGVCTGEVNDATFTSNRPRKQSVHIKQVRRPGTTSGGDLNQPGELAQACGKITILIANRMLSGIARGEPVAWVRNIRLLPDGLEIESRTGPERIEWSQIDKVAIEQGIFHLWRSGEKRPILKLPARLPNFFPGHRVLLDRMQQGSSTETVDA